MKKIAAFDVSSSNIGYSEFEIDNDIIKLVDIKNFSLDTDVEIYQRFDDFAKEMSTKKFDYCIMEARLKSFFSGFSNKNAILSIAAANELASYILNKYCTATIYKYHPNTWRKAAGFVLQRKVKVDIKTLVIEKTIVNEVFLEYLLCNKKEVKDIFPQRIISKGKNKGDAVYITGVNDMADSFLLGIAGIKLAK